MLAVQVFRAQWVMFLHAEQIFFPLTYEAISSVFHVSFWDRKVLSHDQSQNYSHTLMNEESQEEYREKSMKTEEIKI